MEVMGVVLLLEKFWEFCFLNFVFFFFFVYYDFKIRVFVDRFMKWGVEELWIKEDGVVVVFSC